MILPISDFTYIKLKKSYTSVATHSDITIYDLFTRKYEFLNKCVVFDQLLHNKSLRL